MGCTAPKYLPRPPCAPAGLPRGTTTDKGPKLWYGQEGSLKLGRFPRYSDCGAACIDNSTCTKFAWFQFDTGFPLPNICFLYGDNATSNTAIGLPGFGTWHAGEGEPCVGWLVGRRGRGPPPDRRAHVVAAARQLPMCWRTDGALP